MGPDEYPDYPAPHRDPAAICTDYADALRAPRPDPLRDPGGARRAPGPAGGWQHPSRRRRRRAIRLPRRRQRPPLGPALPRLPGHVRGRDDPLAPLHRPQRPARYARQARAGRRDREQRGRHRLRALAQGRGREGLRLHPQRRLGDAQVPLRQADRHSWSRPIPRLPLKLQRRMARDRCRASPRGGWRTSGSPTPTTTSSRRIRPSPASCCCGWARATRWPSPTSELLGDQRRASRTAASRQIDVIVYATGYKITFPFFDAELPVGAGQPAAALQADVQAGHRRPRLPRLRPGHPDALPVRRAAVEAGRRAMSAATTRCPPSRRWRRRSAATSDPLRDTSPTAPATRCRSSGTRTSTTSGRREIPAGRERAAAGMAPKLAGRVVTAEAAAANARVRRGEAEEQPV